MTAPCVFCEIVAGQRHQETVYADELGVAFLSEPPATWGHLLIVPRQHRENIWTTPREELAASTNAAHLLARVARDNLGAVDVNLRHNTGAKAGQDVFHFHLHLVPRYDGDTIQPGCVWGSPPWEPPTGGDTERTRVAELIRNGVGES